MDRWRNLFKSSLVFLSCASCVAAISCEGDAMRRHRKATQTGVVDVFGGEMFAYPITHRGNQPEYDLSEAEIPYDFTYCKLGNTEFAFLYELLAVNAAGQGVYVYDTQLTLKKLGKATNDLGALLVRFTVEKEKIKAFRKSLFETGFFSMSDFYGADIHDGCTRIFDFKSETINHRVGINNCLPKEAIRIIEAEKILFPKVDSLKTSSTLIGKEEMRAIYLEFGIMEQFESLFRAVDKQD